MFPSDNLLQKVINTIMEKIEKLRYLRLQKKNIEAFETGY